MDSKPTPNSGKMSGKMSTTGNTVPLKKKHKAAKNLIFRSSTIRLAKKMSNEIQVSKKAHDVFAGIAYRICEMAADKCNQLVEKVNKHTVSGEDVYFAFDLMLTGDLKQHCLKDINEIIAKNSSKKEVSKK